MRSNLCSFLHLVTDHADRARATATAVAALLLGICPILRAEPPPRFVVDSVWNEDISAAPLHPSSTTMITRLVQLGGFGTGNMQIDFSFHVVHAADDAPLRTIVSHPDYYYSPDCEPLGTAMPVPADAAIEGVSGLTCDNLDNDCHLLVVQGYTLYEAGGVTEYSSTQIESGCLAIWYLDAVYPPEGRGDHCTSADGAGHPIAPMLFNADEIAARLALDATGNSVNLGHAIRFILPNSRIANDGSLGGAYGRLYVRPATHAGGPSGPVDTVPYGSRLRLRSDFPLADYNPAARVILNTFKHCGIVLSDGGSIALTAESDLYTTTSWDDLGIGSHLFFDGSPGQDVTAGDFEVVDTGPRIAETYDCVRTAVVPGNAVFADGFESGDTSQWSATNP